MLRRAGTSATPVPIARWWARAAGAVAAAAALAVAHLAAAVVSPDASPVPAVGELVITLLPAGLVNWGKEVLGFADKPVLLALVIGAVLAVGGLAGQLDHRRRYAGVWIVAVLAAVGAVGVSAATRPSPLAYLPTVLGLGVGYLILRGLVHRLPAWSPAGVAGPPSPARRSFLGLTVAVAASAAVVGIIGQALASAANAVNDARARIRLPRAARATTPLPATVDFGLPGLAPYLTPNADFYRIDTALQVPVIDPAGWSLRVTGLVQREVQIDYATLLGKPLVEHLVTLTCVSNPVGGDLAGNAVWLGYPIRALLAEAGPAPEADMVLSRSADGWTAGTPLSVLTDPGREALLAVGMNGEPLPIEHGFPVRMVVPGLYGYVSATKWVTELKVTTFAADHGYWTPLGWSAHGPVKIASRIDVPRRSTVDAGPVTVAGVAWAQHTGIARVEVRVDAGPWQPAQLADTAGPDTWRQWRFDWQASPGEHTLAVRATDRTGRVQTGEQAPPAPDGATGWHTISVRVR